MEVSNKPEIRVRATRAEIISAVMANLAKSAYYCCALPWNFVKKKIDSIDVDWENFL